jgi:hypothetical protein
MKNSGKIVRAGFWLLLITAVVIGYFKISKTSTTSHYQYIPKGVDGVLAFDLRKIGKKVIEKYRFNPPELGDLLPDDLTEVDDVELQNLGLDPFYKAVIFHFKVDDKIMAAALFKCQPRVFMGYFEKRHGESLEDVYSKDGSAVKIKRYKSTLQDASVCVGNGVGIYCSTTDGSALGEEYYSKLVPFLVEAIDHPENGLLASNKNFDHFKNDDHDVGYWSKGHTQSFGGLSKEFTDSRTYFSFEKGEVAIKSELSFETKNPLKDEIVKLNSDAPFAFSFMAKEESAPGFIEQNVPSKFRQYFDGFSGDFFFEISGHQLFQGFHVEDSTDDNFNTIEVTVKDDDMTPFPEFLSVFSVKSVPSYFESLLKDSSIIEIDGFYEFEMIKGMSCFISSVDNDICFSNSKDLISKLGNKPLDEMYATYSVSLDFVALQGKLPVKGDMGIGVPNLFIQTGFRMLNFEKIQVDAVEVQEGKVIGEGSFAFKDAETHSLLALLDMMKMGISNRSMIEAIFNHTERDAK